MSKPQKRQREDEIRREALLVAARLKADEFRAMVLKRIGVYAKDLQCPRERSERTPCLARDGGMVVVITRFDNPICVGCECSLDRLFQKEQENAAAGNGQK